ERAKWRRLGGAHRVRAGATQRPAPDRHRRVVPRLPLPRVPLRGVAADAQLPRGDRRGAGQRHDLRQRPRPGQARAGGGGAGPAARERGGARRGRRLRPRGRAGPHPSRAPGGHRRARALPDPLADGRGGLQRVRQLRPPHPFPREAAAPAREL
ncbi:MAG: hypothetical protein AVDCRST_MAG68-306, partial [uncultured Gemmatimonadetes bacterium]